MNNRVAADLADLTTRRTALRAGGVLLAGTLTFPGTALAQGTPVAGGAEGGLLLVQSFGKGSFFPTQGDVGAAPYTMILWDAADRGLVFVATEGGSAGLAPTNALIAAIEAGARPRAALVTSAADGSHAERAWALELTYGGPGSDPGAVTYQGEPIEADMAAGWLGAEPAPMPDGPQDLAGGYLLLAGLPGIDLPEGNRIRLGLG